MGTASNHGNRWVAQRIEEMRHLQAGHGFHRMADVRYFDHNATTPLVPAARDAWLRAQEEAWQNPSSPTRDAARIRLRLEGARHSIATLTGAAPDRVVFTSGATEAANAIATHLRRTLPGDAWVAVNPTEHPCVLASFAQEFAGRVQFLPVDASGIVPPGALEKALAPGGTGGSGAARAVAIMAANNETGVILPWAEYALACRSHDASFICDATQWIGKLPAAGFGEADWVFASAHKFGGPKGTGFLLHPAADNGFRGQAGGEQQRGHRGGTEDFPAISAMLASWAEAERSKVISESEKQGWREEFEQTVRGRMPGVRTVAGEADRLWNTVSLVMPAHENHRWVTLLEKRGFAVSTGSACAAGKDLPSHVLAALRYSPDEVRRVIRISSGWATTREDWQALAEALPAVAAELDRTAVPTVRA